MIVDFSKRENLPLLAIALYYIVGWSNLQLTHAHMKCLPLIVLFASETVHKDEKSHVQP